jgi:hypothetical protein
MKQLRIDFPDYTASNQERDAQRHEEKQQKDVYVVKVRGTYGVYIQTDRRSLSSHSEQGESFIDFVTSVKEFCEDTLKIKPKFHCVLNKGIEEHILEQLEIKKLLER